MRVLALCGSLQAESTNLDIETAPEPVKQWRAALVAHDAVFIATPEYGHSFPGGLKNAIDWVIGSGELEGKIVAITASAAGVGRGQLERRFRAGRSRKGSWWSCSASWRRPWLTEGSDHSLMSLPHFRRVALKRHIAA